MSGTGIDPNTPLTVRLAARQWNNLLAVAAEGIGSAQALLSEVQRQCMQQSVQDDAEHMPMRGGGSAPRPRTASRPNGEATP